MVIIYDRNGKVKAEVSADDNSVQVKEIEGDNELSLSFKHYGHIALDVDDYVDFEGERYWLCEKYHPRQLSAMEWDYDIKLYGVESLIRNVLVIKRVDGEDDPEFSLTASVREHVAMVVNCMNDGMRGIAEWKVGLVEGTENITIDYYGKYCDEALKEIADKVGTEYWMDGNMVNICRCEHGEPVVLGYDKGLMGLEPDRADNVKFYTRLYPVGSSRNIDPERYGHSRLQLPDGLKYVEVNADRYGRVDHYEKTSFSDIYPRRIGVVSGVRSEERRGENGEMFTIYYFSDSDLTFDPNDYEIAGKVKRVSFQEGSELAGLGAEDGGTYYFEANFNSDTREFEIITTWPYDDGSQLPGGNLVPKEGDRYILWNISMPDEYYGLAEAEFLEAVKCFNKEHGLDVTIFKGTTDHVWVEETGVTLDIGRRVMLESEEYFPETGVRDSRITKISRKVNLPSQVDVEIGDVLGRTMKQKFSDDIATAMNFAQSAVLSVPVPEIIRTGDKTAASDYNLYSAKRSKSEFLSRVADDVAAGRIRFVKGLRSEGVSEFEREATFEDGAQFGASFAEGVAGFGGKIDDRGDAWLGGLHLRDFLEVPELRYNRTEISIGNSWHAPGGGVIEKVMPDYNDDGTPADTGTVTLRLEDGEIGAVAVGDLCQGIFHDEVNPSNNATADSDDGRGNFHFAGFCSVYFKITEIKERGRNSVFKYRLRELSSRWRWRHHPSAQMHFVAYGSVTYEDRKTSRYATRTYERYLVKVNGWELTSKNIAAQFGDLSNLSLFGLQMSGYSAYLNNIYMSGRIEQLDLSPRMELEYDNDNFIAPGQTKSVICRVLRGFEDITGAVTKWSVTRVSDSAVDTLAWLQKDKVQNFAGEIDIAYDDLLGAADAGTTFTFTAETGGKTATASITLRRNPLNGEDGKDGTDYTQNLLLGSEFPVADRWTTEINVTIDTDRTFEGRNSVKCAQSGLTANAYRGILQSYDTNLREGDEFTASAWYYCENPAEVDGYAALEIQVFNGSERIKTGQTHLDLTKAGEWRQAHTTVTIPKEATHFAVALYLSRNGTVWFASPKLERGVNERPVWSPNPADRIPEPVQQYYLSTSDTVLSGGSWTDSKPLYVEGRYYWTRTKRLYGDGTVEYTDPVCVTGEKGQDGADGKDGINGKDGVDGKDGIDGVNGTDYTNNLLRNSDFADGFDGWTANSIVELDAAMTLDGRVSALIAASGLDANKYYGLSSLLEYTGAPVDMTFSLSARTDDRMSFKDRPEDENLSRYPYMEIRCLNADKTRLKTIAANVLPSVVDEWQRISVSGQTEEGTRWIEVAVYIPRNGRLWVNGAKLEFGDNPATVWTPYAKGLDAYTVMLSSESHVFEGDTEKAVEASTECVVTAYKGTVARPVTIGAVTGAPSGMTVVRADNNTVSAKIKVSVTPTLTTRQGVLRIPVAVDGIIFEKTLSWTLALKGAQGDKGDKGDEGIQGCLYRVTQWAAERDYRNDSAEKTDSLRYVDVVIIPDYTLKTKGRAYRCVKTHQSTGDNAPGTAGGNDVWEELNEMAPIYTPLLLADNAVITLLQSNQVIVMKDDGTTVNAALGRGKYPLWIGATDPENANFKVDDEGKAKMTEAEVSGKVTAGIANGQRVELQPDNKAMKIYDEDGAEASSFEGNRYTGTAGLFGSKSGTLGIINGRGVRTLKFTGAGMESGSVTDTLHDNIFVSDRIKTDTPVEVLVTGYLYTTFTKTTVGGSIIGPVDPDFPDGSGGGGFVKPGDSEIIGPVPVTDAGASVKLYLDTYSDAGLTDRIGSQEVASCNKRDVGVEFTRKSVKTTTGGYHVLRLSISIHATGSGAEGTVKWGSAVGGKPDISGSYTSDFYVSRYFANGFCLGTSERDYIMAYDQGEKGMRLVFENNGYGLEASDAGLRHRHHNGNWLGMPLLVFKSVYKYTAAYGYQARTAATKSCNGVAPAVSRLAQGHIRLTYPSGWPALSLDNAIVNVTGYGTVAEGGGSPVKANIREITSDYIDITLSDDQSLNDGAFMIDISLIE